MLQDCMKPFLTRSFDVTTPVHVHDSGMVPKNNLKKNTIMEESQGKVTMHLEANLMKLTPHSFPLTSIFQTLEKINFQI